MAILIEACTVVVRNATLVSKYPGGVESFLRDAPNRRFCADEFLSCVSFMEPSDADVFVGKLAAKGLMPYRQGAATDVAIVHQDSGPVRPCKWLELGKWGSKQTVAWLAGAKRGDVHTPPSWNANEQIQHLTAEEAKRRLEYVRTDGNVDVYRDKQTGQELYVGRTVTGGQQTIARHDELYRQARDLVKGLLVIHGQPSGILESSQREQLLGAAAKFQEVIEINPGNWSAMWLLGKVCERLGQRDTALSWFSRAHRLNPEQPDVAREAAIAAMEADRPEEAIEFCRRALEARPDDAGLKSNLALALLFSGKPREAKSVAAEALSRDPADSITGRLVQIISEVLSGARACPRHTRDLR